MAARGHAPALPAARPAPEEMAKMDNMDNDRQIITAGTPPPLWLQRPVRRPGDALELPPDNALARGLEVTAWSFARLEHWLSPGGWLRAWLRLNLILAIALSVAGMLLLPAAARFLEELARSGRWLGITVLDLITIIERLPAAAVSIGLLYIAYLAVRRLMRRRDPRPNNYPPGY
jgi:hypothetical protein